MNDYYKDELLSVVSEWTTGQLENYIKELEKRIENTRDQVRALRSLRRRMLRNQGPKDTGQRGAK